MIFALHFTNKPQVILPSSCFGDDRAPSSLLYISFPSVGRGTFLDIKKRNSGHSIIPDLVKITWARLSALCWFFKIFCRKDTHQTTQKRNKGGTWEKAKGRRKTNILKAFQKRSFQKKSTDFQTFYQKILTSNKNGLPTKKQEKYKTREHSAKKCQKRDFQTFPPLLCTTFFCAPGVRSNRRPVVETR